MTFREYAIAVNLHEMALIDRALHCMFWLKDSTSKNEVSCREISNLLSDASLPASNVTSLDRILKLSRRVVRGKNKTFKLHLATEEELERSVGHLFAPSATLPAAPLVLDIPFFGQPNVTLAKEMAEIYIQLHCLENSARNLIRSKLETAHGENWWTQVQTPDMKKKVQERIREEQRNKWHQSRGRHPLNYLDFGDLKDLICNSWTYFKDVFPNQNWVITRLAELEKCRNVVAHNNVLGDIEISRVRLYFGDWCRQLGGII